MRRLNLILLAIACVFLYWILQKVGWAVLWRHLVEVGWNWPLLLLPYGVVCWLETISWKYLLLNPLPGDLPLGRLFWLRLGGEALNQLTPTASVGGEPFKASRLQALGVPWDAATASVVIHKGIQVLSMAFYILLGLALTPLLLPAASQYMWSMSVAALALAAASIIFVIGQRWGIFGHGFRFLSRRGWWPASLKEAEGFLANLDAALHDFYRHHPGRAALAFLFYFVSWLLHAVEVYVIFWLLGHPIGWGLALCLDALSMLFIALGFFLPASVGVQDGGQIVLALGFNLGLTLGAAFSILRRLREAFWLILGLAVVARER